MGADILFGISNVMVGRLQSGKVVAQLLVAVVHRCGPEQPSPTRLRMSLVLGQMVRGPARKSVFSCAQAEALRLSSQTSHVSLPSACSSLPRLRTKVDLASVSRRF